MSALQNVGKVGAYVSYGTQGMNKDKVAAGGGGRMGKQKGSICKTESNKLLIHLKPWI